jgi:tetratricopeptide (TPR) repeat protein
VTATELRPRAKARRVPLRGAQRTRWLCLFAFSALLAFTSSAGAQKRASAANKQEDKAGSHDPAYRSAIEEALREFELGNWNEALALFQKAHAIEPNARTLRGIGFCLFENRRYVDAMRHLEQAMVDTRSPLSPAQRSSTQQVLERAAAFVAHVSVQLSPPEARLSIDGKETPLDRSGALLLDPGEHELSASAPDHAARSLHVVLESGKNEPVQLALDRRQAAPEPVQEPPSSADAAPARPMLDDRAHLKRGLMIGGFSVAGAALIAGTVTGIMTISRKKQLDKRCPDHTCPESESNTLDSAKGLALGSSISFGMAALGVGLGLTGALLPNMEKKHARGVLRFDVRFSAVALSGSF